MADNTVHNPRTQAVQVAHEGTRYWGICSCGWRSAARFENEQIAKQAADRHAGLLTFSHFIACVQEWRDMYPAQRYGQSLMNVLDYLAPAWAEEVRGTDADPFYLDEKVERFYEFIGGKLHG